MCILSSVHLCILSSAFRKVGTLTQSHRSVFTNTPIICCRVAVVRTVQSCVSLKSLPITACNVNVLASLPFSPLSKQCQHRLMVSLSDPKQCSLWLQGMTTRLHSGWLCRAFTCLPVPRWDANMLTGYLHLSLTLHLHRSISLLVSSLSRFPVYLASHLSGGCLFSHWACAPDKLYSCLIWSCETSLTCQGKVLVNSL